MRLLFGCPDIVSLTEKFLMARNFFRIFTENNPVMGYSKTFFIPEAKGLKQKVQALCEHIHQSLSKKKITLRSVQSLVGSLNFVCRAISPGRAFMGRLIALTRRLTKPHHRVRFTTGARLDLLMVLRFLADFNGVELGV